MKLMLPLCAALALSGCALPTMTLGGPQAPAPLAATTIDDRALTAAWKTHDLLQDALNLYMDAKPSIIGTPQARRVADVNDAITAALSAAEAAAAAGSTTSYLAALTDAREALAQMKTALASMKGQ